LARKQKRNHKPSSALHPFPTYWYRGRVKPRICWICNELYPPTGPGQKYCPDCEPEVERRDSLAKRRRDPERYNGYDRASRERNREEICARDRERGRSEERLAYSRELYARQCADPKWKEKRTTQMHEQYLRRRAKKPDAGPGHATGLRHGFLNEKHAPDRS